MLDWARIHELRDEIGNDDYAEVVALFFLEVDAAIERLKVPASQPEREADLHFLKGSALNLGFARLGQVCHDGEVRAAAGILEDAEVAEVIAMYESSRDMFEACRVEAA